MVVAVFKVHSLSEGADVSRDLKVGVGCTGGSSRFCLASCTCKYSRALISLVLELGSGLLHVE